MKVHQYWTQRMYHLLVPKYSMPEVYLEGSPALESTGASLSAPTWLTFTKPLVATTCTRHAHAVIYGDLRCMHSLEAIILGEP